jgi:uncharacterized protein YxjI
MSPSTALSTYGTRFMARKAFSVIGKEFRIFGPEGHLQFVVKQKAFKLKEEIVIFADEDQKQPRLTIKARSMMDLSATYDVTDAATGDKVGALRRKGLKSVLRDEWAILDTSDTEVGRIQEDSTFFALIRRFLSNLVPQTFNVDLDGRRVGQIKQRWNPFRLAYDVDFSADASGTLDRRLGVAMTILLLAIEGRQN